MRILFVAHNSDPFTNTGYGSGQRTHLLLKACAAICETDVCAFVDGVVSNIENCRVVHSKSIDGNVLQYASFPRRLLSYFISSSPFFLYRKQKECSAVIRNLINTTQYDFIVTRYLENAVCSSLLDYADRLIIDVDDEPSVSHLIRIKAKKSIVSRIFPQLRVLPDQKIVNTVEKRCRHLFFSNPDQAVLDNSSYLPNIPIRRNDNPEFSIAQNGHVLFFVGVLAYSPNWKGLLHFLSKVFPIVRSRIPDATFRIAGSLIPKDLADLIDSTPGVEYLGFVDDLESEYDGCRVVVAPIYEGAGTNIKVLEAMAMKRPCVTTPVGFRGFNDIMVSGRDVLVADNDADFASKVCLMLSDREKNKEISLNGYNIVTDHFSETTFVETVKNALCAQSS